MRDHLEPESFFDDTQDETRPALADEAKKALEMAAARKKSMPPPPAPATERDPEKGNDFHKALAQLQRQRDSGAPAPPAPASRPSPASSTGTGPNRPLSAGDAQRRFPTGNELSVPSAKDLAANVSRRSMPSVPPPASASVPPPAPSAGDAEANVLNALLGGVVPSATSHTSGTAPFNMNALGLKPGSGASALGPQRTPLPIAVVSGSGLRINTPERPQPAAPAPFGQLKTSPSAQAPPRPGNSPSRIPPGYAPGGRASTPPGATPAKQYDFKRWSSPDISEMPTDGAPVTFQVYTAQDVANGRAPMRSLPMIEPPAKKAGSIALKVGLAIVGLVIVLVTAGAVILVSQDEPKRQIVPLPSATNSAPLIPSSVPDSIPPTVTIGDPTPPPEDPTTAGTATTKPKSTKAVPAPAPQPSVKTVVTPPPNPYGK